MPQYDVAVIGGGPAGLSAASSAAKAGARVLLIEREDSLGGILKQCIHDGFGLTRYHEKLSGPEYAFKEIEGLEGLEIKCLTSSFVTKIDKTDEGFRLHIVNAEGVNTEQSKTLILATGCRERTSRQVFIQGTNPAGVMTAGQAQNYINRLGLMPIKKAVILGSGDIGLIMARRITLEGGEVEGVYEVKSTPSGLARNIAQCLKDFNIPLHLSHTVTEVFGTDRLEAVTIAKVDEKMRPIPGTERHVECDALILSVGLIPENELAKKLGISLERTTKGPIVDQNFMTDQPGVFSCGNAMHVNDLADYVSESGEIAGKAAATYAKQIPAAYSQISHDKHIAYVVPQRIDHARLKNPIIFYFRSSAVYQNMTLVVRSAGKEILRRKYLSLRPPEMERISLTVSEEGDVEFALEEQK